jgi:hypothetical protein
LDHERARNDVLHVVIRVVLTLKKACHVKGSFLSCLADVQFSPPKIDIVHKAATNAMVDGGARRNHTRAR